MKFNQPTRAKNTTTNYEGELAYSLDPKTELYSLACTSALQPKFYQSNTEDQLIRLRDLLNKVPPDFAAKLAIYIREQMYLRSIPLVMCVELAKIHRGDNLIAKLTEQVIQRADEITEILAYYQLANDRKDTKKLNKLSHGISRGIKQIFESGKFDEYSYSKYDRDGDVKLRDALFLSHPKPQDEKQEGLFKKIVDRTLEIPYTWETRLSEAGQKGESKKAIWEELIDSKKVGYMATLRNLRNCLEAEVSHKHIAKICNYISTPEAVRKSKQLPFRFLAAYRMIKEVESDLSPIILEALEYAVRTSVENLKGFGLETSVLVACDVSASMQKSISPRSSLQNYDIGLMLGMLLQNKSSRVVSGFFGDIWKVVQLPRNNILANADELHRREGEVGYSTNGHLVIDWLIQKKHKADRVMIFTDCQMWDSFNSGSNFSRSWQQYKNFHPSAKLYLFDLAGYGNTPIDVRQNDVHLIAGWSDKIFDVLDATENGDDAIKKIQSVNL